jgi:aspartate-semialdehyde dehydrogenase
VSEGRRAPAVGILGATGAVGETLLRVLAERRFPMRELRLLASERSAGRLLPYAGREIAVEEATLSSFDGLDLAIFSAGAARSRAFAPAAVRAGALVIDNSSAFRLDPEVPLVVPEVNPEAARLHRGLIANPNCSTMQLVPVLRPLHEAAGLEHVTVATYQAVSGTGRSAGEALVTETRRALEGADAEALAYPHPIAFNAVPAGTFAGDDGLTDEEIKLVHESRKILGLPDLRVSPTCVRVPVRNAHSEAVWVTTERELGPDEAREVLGAAPGVTVLDDPSRDLYPTALAASGRDDVLVGRIRRDPGAARTLALWIVADNLRKGAATNAVQIAELCLAEDLLGSRTAA